MIEILLAGYAIFDAIVSSGGDTRVRHGKDILGHKYKTVDGDCYRCGGSGEVHGQTCRKCGGSGRFYKRIWYS